MHSPSQSLWSSDGEEVHSVTLGFLFLGRRTITARQRCGPGTEPVQGFPCPACTLLYGVHQLTST